MPSETTLRVGTRGSPLALGQTGQFTAHLAETHPMLGAPGAVETVVITTTGDRVQNRLLLELGGKGLFTKELDEALLDGRIDLAIHSMKDVPAELPVGIVLTAVLPREDVHDAFISRKAASLSELPPGSTVGTASLRRKTQIINRYPELRVVPLRGNVDTRLGKLDAGEVDATLLAVAGLKRLGRAQEITSVIGADEILPAIGQGALAATWRADDNRTQAFLAPLIHPPTIACVMAERAVLVELGGSCTMPIAACAEMQGTGSLTLKAALLHPSGSERFDADGGGPVGEAERIGAEVAKELYLQGGPALFKAIRESQPDILRPHPEMKNED